MVKEILNYKGYRTTLEYSKEDNVYCGKIEGIKDLVMYYGETKEEARVDFQESVDDYINFLKRIGM